MSELSGMCLRLDSLRWHDLDTSDGEGRVIGGGAAVPGWIRSIESGQIRLSGWSARTWDPRYLSDVFTGLTHDYYLFSAAYAAVPHFVRIALRCGSRLRSELLLFAGEASLYQAQSIPDDLRGDFACALRQAFRVIPGLLPIADDERDTLDLIAALVALSECTELGAEMIEMCRTDRPYQYVSIYCPGCRRRTLLAPVGAGFKRARQHTEWLADVARVVETHDDIDLQFQSEVRDAGGSWDGESLTPNAVRAWLPALAIGAGRPDLARRLGLLLSGVVSCPECSHRFVPWGRLVGA